jgi:hypothetical protein
MIQICHFSCKETVGEIRLLYHHLEGQKRHKVAQ